jgi:hypothetical protein
LANDVLRRAGFRAYRADDEHALDLHGLSVEETNRRTLRAERMLRGSGYVTHIVPDIVQHTEPDPTAELRTLDPTLTALAAAVYRSETPDEVAGVLQTLVGDDVGVLDLTAEEALETSADWLVEAHRILPEDLADAPDHLASLAEQYRDLNRQLAVVMEQLRDRAFPQGEVSIRPRPGARLAYRPIQTARGAALARAALARSTAARPDPGEPSTADLPLRPPAVRLQRR